VCEFKLCEREKEKICDDLAQNKKFYSSAGKYKRAFLPLIGLK
jgi:hypothetical protein